MMSELVTVNQLGWSAAILQVLYDCICFIMQQQCWTEVTSADVNSSAVLRCQITDPAVEWEKEVECGHVGLLHCKWNCWFVHVQCAQEDIIDFQSWRWMCLHLLCRNNCGHQVVLQGHWWWNVATSLGVQVLLHSTHKRFMTNITSESQSDCWVLVTNFLNYWFMKVFFRMELWH